MTEEKFSVPLTCLFCGSVLEGKEDAVFQSGDLIPCSQCGEGNDFESVVEIGKEKAVERVKEDLQSQLDSIFKRK
jgi:hypothetical protein